MPDKVEYIDEFLEKNPKGTFLITMAGHITCAIDGCIYDTFDPSERYVWQVFEVKERTLISVLFSFITNLLFLFSRLNLFHNDQSK